MKNNYSILIPARSKSSRLPNKNLLKLGNKQLIDFTIDFAVMAQKKKIIKNIIINSDSEEILSKSKNLDILKYKRRAELAKNNSLMKSVINDFLLSKIAKSLLIDNLIIMQPTSPYRKLDDLKKCIDLFEKSKLKGKILISVMPNNNSCLKSFLFDKKKNKYVSIIKNDFIFENTQNLPSVFSPNGSYFIFNKKDFLLNNDFPKKNFIIYKMKNQFSFDIDTINDFLNFKNYIKSKDAY